MVDVISTGLLEIQKRSKCSDHVGLNRASPKDAAPRSPPPPPPHN